MRLYLICLLAMALEGAGCVYIPMASLPQFTSAQLASGSATLRVQPSIAEGGYRAQTLILPYTSAAINHLVVSIYKLSGTTETPVVETVSNIGKPMVRDLDQQAISTGLAVSNLAHSTTYRLRARAYKAPGQTSADLISDDSTSFADIIVGVDDRPVPGVIPVKLVDRLFAAESTTSFQFTNGQIVDASSESIR